MKSGWVTKKLGEVCEDSIRRLKEIDDSRFLYIDISSIDRVRKTVIGATEYDRTSAPGRAQQIVEVGDVLVSTVRPNLNAVAIVENESKMRRIASTGFCVLRAREEVISRYIYYFTNTEQFIAPLVAVSEKAAYPSVTDKIVKNVEIPIPPLAEQKRIVAKIDAAFEKIDALKANAEKNLANAKELFQSALDEAMRPKKGWEEKRLGDVASIRVGPFGSSLHKADYVESGVPLVNPCHMKDSKISNRISTQVSHDKARSLKEYRLKAGDIVFARRGEIGRLAFVSEKEDGYLCGTGSLFARFRERYDIQFLYFFFSSKSFVERLELLSTGTTMKSINSSALESMSFSIPPMNEQQRLAKQLDSLSQKTETLQQNYTRQIADCAEMRQAILREAFEGRL